MSDDNVKQHYHSAAYKIKAILKPSEKDYLEKLQEHVSVYNWSTFGDQSKTLFLREIQQALVNKQVLEIAYQKKHAEEVSCREIEPIGLCNYASRWHLFAWCNERQDYRDFRLDRIKELKVTNKTYLHKTHISIAEFMEKLAPFSDTPNIILSVPADRKKNIEESKYYYGFLEEKENENRVEMKFSNSELAGFAAWLIGSRSLAQVLEPPELEEIVQSYIDELTMLSR